MCFDKKSRGSGTFWLKCDILLLLALVVKLADTYALGAYVARRRGSNPLEGTLFYHYATSIVALPASFSLGILMVSIPLSIWASADWVSIFSGNTILRENGPQ